MADAMLSVEMFAAKDSDGELTGLAMAVPCNCGLAQADSLRVDGLNIVAMRASSMMPLNFPPLTTQSRSNLIAWSKAGDKLAVAEIMATGLLHSYFLHIDYE